MGDEEIEVDMLGFIDTNDPRHSFIVYIIMMFVSLFQGMSIMGIIVAIVKPLSIWMLIGLVAFNLIAFICQFIAIYILKHMLDGAVKTSKDDTAATETIV